jgi:hypothetical protein
VRHRFIIGHSGISLTNVREPIDNESRYQVIEYILTSVNRGVGVEHLKHPSIRRH